MASYCLHHQDTYGMPYMHRQVISVRDRRHPSCALLPWITTFTCLSFLHASVEVCCWLLLPDTVVLSAVFINVKYVLLHLQLQMFKWNLNCKKKVFLVICTLPRRSNENSYCVRCQRFCCCCCCYSFDQFLSTIIETMTEKNYTIVSLVFHFCHKNQQAKLGLCYKRVNVKNNSGNHALLKGIFIWF